MGEIESYTFEFKELAEMLVKKSSIHSGIWTVIFQFGIAGGNVNTDPGGKEFHPAAIVPILKIILQKVNEENNLSVDAAKVNPAPTAE